MFYFLTLKYCRSKIYTSLWQTFSNPTWTELIDICFVINIERNVQCTNRIDNNQWFTIIIIFFFSKFK